MGGQGGAGPLEGRLNAREFFWHGARADGGAEVACSVDVVNLWRARTAIVWPVIASAVAWSGGLGRSNRNVAAQGRAGQVHGARVAARLRLTADCFGCHRHAGDDPDGHSKIETTKNIYGHLFAQDRSQIFKAINEAVSRLYVQEGDSAEGEAA
jgi:hypothetical protein